MRRDGGRHRQARGEAYGAGQEARDAGVRGERVRCVAGDMKGHTKVRDTRRQGGRKQGVWAGGILLTSLLLSGLYVALAELLPMQVTNLFIPSLVRLKKEEGKNVPPFTL